MLLFFFSKKQNKNTTANFQQIKITYKFRFDASCFSRLSCCINVGSFKYSLVLGFINNFASNCGSAKGFFIRPKTNDENLILSKKADRLVWRMFFKKDDQGLFCLYFYWDDGWAKLLFRNIAMAKILE